MTAGWYTVNSWHNLFCFVVQAEEEARSLQKKIQTIENDLDQTQEQLTQVLGKLEEKEKALQNVSHYKLALLPLPTNVFDYCQAEALKSQLGVLCCYLKLMNSYWWRAK